MKRTLLTILPARMKKQLLFAAFLLTGSATVYAIPMGYTTEASWLAALGSVTLSTEDFEATALGSLTAPGTTDVGLFSVTLNAVGDAGTNEVTNESATGMSGRHLNLDIDGDNNTQVDFSSFDVGGVIGFAGTWASTTTGDLLTLTVNGTTLNFDDFLSGSGNGFFGIVDSMPFTIVETSSKLR